MATQPPEVDERAIRSEAFSDGYEQAIADVRRTRPAAPELRSPRYKRQFERDFDQRYKEGQERAQDPSGR